ncbi:MAG: transporter substrate-binding domain-containing protein [Planctomycetes bacterium]|nr:transporter substrate-binding domain-containing protein [Planctomycetota bacterium]
MKKILIIIGVFLIMTFCRISVLFAEGAIIWPHFSYPPMFIIENGKAAGFGIDIRNMFWRNMPEYDHKAISAPPKRLFENMRFGKKYCTIGPVKTPDREEYLHYSLPCRVAFADFVVMRKEDADKLDNSKISLKTLLGDERLTFGGLSGASHGVELDRLIDSPLVKAKKAFQSGPNAMENLILMLVEKRVDWMMWEPATVWHIAQKKGFTDRLAVVRPMEMANIAEAGYVACPRNEWGREVIEKVNRILRQAVSTEVYYNYQGAWVPDNLLPEYKRLYEEMIVKPAGQ